MSSCMAGSVGKIAGRDLSHTNGKESRGLPDVAASQVRPPSNQHIRAFLTLEKRSQHGADEKNTRKTLSFPVMRRFGTTFIHPT